MKRRLPPILGTVAGLATLLLVGPVAVAVMLLRSSPEAQGPTIAAQILIVAIVLVLAALVGFATWGLTRIVIRLLS